MPAKGASDIGGQGQEQAAGGLSGSFGSLSLPSLDPGAAPEMGEVYAEKYRADVVIADKYRLVRRLGEGGMGAVWLARNVMLDSEVAIKLIRHEAAAPEARARLLQEARAAAKLSHPSIVKVFDFGQTAFGDPFIVMELLSGESLGAHLDRRGRLPASEAVGLILPVARALQLAHDRGVIHRDLKPDNVLLVAEAAGHTRPKLVDFGLAKSHGDDIVRDLTMAGTVLGSPNYMSPEQARGRSDIDWRADIWALSVVLYEMITGKLPFDGPNYNALLTSIILDTPTPTTELAAGDGALWAILEKGLEKDVTRRWQSMRDLVGALVDWGLSQGMTEDCAGTRLLYDGRSSLDSIRPSLVDLEAQSQRVLRHTPTLGGEQPAPTLSTETGPLSLAPHEAPLQAKGRATTLRLVIGAALTVAVLALAGGGYLASRKSAPSSLVPAAQPPAVVASHAEVAPTPAPSAPVEAVAVESASASPSAAPLPKKNPLASKPAASSAPQLPAVSAPASPPPPAPPPPSAAPPAAKKVPLIPLEPNY